MNFLQMIIETGVDRLIKKIEKKKKIKWGRIQKFIDYVQELLKTLEIEIDKHKKENT